MGARRKIVNLYFDDQCEIEDITQKATAYFTTGKPKRGERHIGGVWPPFSPNKTVGSIKVEVKGIKNNNNE